MTVRILRSDRSGKTERATARMRHCGRTLAFLGGACCLSSGSGCDWTGRQPSGALGNGSFSFACDSPGSGPAQPNPDAWCATLNTPSHSAALPAVAVGAPFRLHIDASGSADPQPAVPRLAHSAGGGWAILQPGWLGFIAWSGSDVVDFTHVRAKPIASLAWQSDPRAELLDIFRPAVNVAVLPLDANGETLAGAITCAFMVSDPAVLEATGAGRVAKLTPRAPGDVTLAALCMGARIEASLHVSGTRSGSSDSGSEGGPEDAADRSNPDAADERGTGAPDVGGNADGNTDLGIPGEGGD